MTDPTTDTPITRARPRRKLFQPAELDTAAGRCRVHLIDVSESGAQLHAAPPPPAASFVTLLCGTLQRSGRVAWVKGSRFGVSFAMPLTGAQVDQLLALGTPTRRAG